MKFLHLSDLHIGKSVNGFPMLDEQRHAFNQIIRNIQTERPAAVVIAGDVYDRAAPSVEAVRLFDDFLTELADTGAAVLLVAGNHDSPERMNYASRLLSERRLHLCGVFDGTLRKVTLTDEHGNIHFWLLPFIKPSSLRGVFDGIESYNDAAAAALGTADIDYTQRNVLVAHQFFAKMGVSPLRSESELNPIGGLDEVGAGLVERFDYVALGHLHGAQPVGAEHIRYCGSPVKYSFSEWRHEKSVTVAEIGEKGNLHIKTLPLTPIHDMREIRGGLDTLLSDEFSSGIDKEDYLRVILTDEGWIIDPAGKLRSVYPNVMDIDYDNKRTKIDLSAVSTDAQTVKKLGDYDLFAQFFLETQGFHMDAQQAEIVRELLERPGEDE
jgi:exonuclease SbcD